MENAGSLGEELVAAINQWVAESPDNTLQNETNDRAFDEPLVGFAAGDDAYWPTFKEHVGPYCWTPEEAFAQAFPESPASPLQLTVISWILPQTEATRLETRKEKIYPPESWARARVYGEPVNEKLRHYVIELLAKRGIRAVAPALLPNWARMPSDKFTYSSKWSERHVAFVAGLGTFGLCDGLITAKGKAMRTGSVVAEVRIPATLRPYTDHHAYCLWFSHGTCKKCIPRCPVNALSEKGHDKLLCCPHVHETCKDYIAEHYGIEGYACGLCQTGVPCESRIPLKS